MDADEDIEKLFENYNAKVNPIQSAVIFISYHM